MVIQKYVEPCLLLAGARKFDIRAWVLVSNWNPLTVWMYEPYFRVCTEEHSLDAKSLANQYKHLCNRCVQVKNEDYDDADDAGGCMWSVESMREYLGKFGDGPALWADIERQMMRISMLVMHSVQDLIDNKPGCFEWFGLDFMVDVDFNVWNLECNISPDLSKGTDVLERLVPNAFNKVWDMLLCKPPKEEERSREDCWDLVFHGRGACAFLLSTYMSTLYLSILVSLSVSQREGVRSREGNREGGRKGKERSREMLGLRASAR